MTFVHIRGRGGQSINRVFAQRRMYIRRKIYVEIFFTVFDFYRRDSCSGFTSFSDSRVNRFTSVLPPKKIKVLRPDMKFRKRTPIFLRKHDLRRRNLHPVFKWGGERAYCVTGSLDGSWSPFVYGVLICIYICV